MTTQVPASMLAFDVATQAELDAASAVASGAATAAAAKLSGDLVQTVVTQTGAVSTGTGTIPLDDTIPQISEGTEFLTASITPTNAANTLIVEVVAYFGSTVAGGNMVGALFKDAGADALAVCAQSFASGHIFAMTLRFKVAAGSTSAMTFRFRAGNTTAGTTTLNGSGGARLFGGAYSSTISVTEIKA